jgi:endonuclease/exonuclease/phosphatase family metal-dependent hydrolase
MSQPRFRVVSYNVLDGFTTHPGRRERVADWLAGRRADVVALCELNHYTEDRLQRECRHWGHEYAVQLKLEGYPTGLTSRTPITDVERVTEGFHHGVLHGRTAGIDFLVVHLSPHEFRVRQAEAARLADWVRRLLADGRRVIVLGDFNSLSPADRPLYEARGLFDYHRSRAESLADRNLNDGQPDFTVHQVLLDAGLADVIARHVPLGPERVTCATPLIRSPGTDDASWQRGQRRIDFLLADAELAARSIAASVFNGASMDALSDHYPIEADFAWPGGGC